MWRSKAVGRKAVSSGRKFVKLMSTESRLSGAATTSLLAAPLDLDVELKVGSLACDFSFC